MDLRSIINNEGAEAAARKQATPITPIQTTPSQQFREFNQPHPQSVGKHPSQDYGHHGQPPFSSPNAPYQVAYQGRPAAPPPLQPPSQNDLRSPVGSQYSAQSPYRNTPSSSVSGGQYPFPPSNHPQSPAQHQPYPSGHQQRDSYPQSNAPPPHLQQQGSFGQPSPTPHTPTIGTPGPGQPYFQHQRSQSSHSHTASTPTSAQSQPQFYQQFPQDSPVSANHFPPTPIPQHHRQQSQPGIPLGPPISIPRQPSGGYPQPTSPYQQRPPSSGMISHQQLPPHASSPQQQSATIPRMPSTPSAYGSQRNSLGEQSRRSHSERERSVSVSPKTQVPGLPRSESVVSQHTPQPQVQSQPHPQSQPLQQSQQHPDPSLYTYSPNQKRKMDDREISQPPPSASLTNGHGQPPTLTSSPLQHQPVKKRPRYSEPPVWARSSIGRVKKTNSLIPQRRQVNGNAPPNGAAPQVQPSGLKAGVNGHPAPVVIRPTDNGPVGSSSGGPLGQWEPSITGQQPYEEVSKIVADWLFVHVVNRADAGELSSRGVEVEIEAKLGQLIDKDINQRFFLPVQSECILQDKGRTGFRSSMTEAQHKALNGYLNQKVTETHPQNPNQPKERVPIIYTHRRERDRFYELPPGAQQNLPASIRKELNPRHTVKVRVTHDQRTGELLACIIKARVADLDLYMPRSPLDCRISINLEMRYDGDVTSLMASTENTRLPDRNKDRLSYKQSHYQVDLTQVTTADGGAKPEKEHELEIELSAAKLREQGLLAMSQKPHKYAELVQGLIDNVRVLTRAVPGENVVLN